MAINPPTEFGSIVIPPAPVTVGPAPAQKPKAKKPVMTNFSKLTEETIRNKTQNGDTPLHRAAGTGKICEIPRHLLQLELFLMKNNCNRTPIHRAARNGQLDKVPKEFLTKETLTISTEYEKKESRTGSTPPRIETPLHTAALYGHANQIPKEFLTLEFLSIEATGHRNTVLQYLFMSNSLDVIPDIYTNSALLDYKNSRGWTLRQEIEAKREYEAYVARVRTEPATEKQKEKLRWFGCTFGEGVTKGQASNALDKCVKDFPEREWAYYSRPATEEQMTKLRSYYGKNFDEVDGPLNYGNIKELIQLRETEKRQKEELKEMEKLDYDCIIYEFLRWRCDYCPKLTFGRVKKAARALDKINPEWTKTVDCQDLLHQKVTELYPGILEEDLK